MITTERLIIMPLTYEQLLQYIQNDGSLDAALQLNLTAREISDDLKEALEQTIVLNVADPLKNYLFNSLWTIILKSENRMVGDLCFIGAPNAAGEIEIGYGTYEADKGKGYMTEAVGGMVQWAEQQPEIQAIIASTEKSNPASSAVLQKNNFVNDGETETLFQWRRVLNDEYLAWQVK